MDPILFVSVVILVGILSFIAGYKSIRNKSYSPSGKRIEEYPFYPFVVNEKGLVEFNPDLFIDAVNHFLRNKEPLAARQLIIIGEQNFLRNVLGSEDLNLYKKLYRKYDGDSIITDNEHYLENYKRIVQLLGKSFSGTGIEILLHNLVNPSKSIVAIENGEVTGRKIENGTTNLVLDLKTRNIHNQQKLNYELNIGSRKFKCTTIPIFRPDFGLVGAVCINVDVHFLEEEVLHDIHKMESFIKHLTITNFELEENILSPQEYEKAISGKRHYLDDELLFQKRKGRNRQLLAILFSDIVSYSAVMGADEGKALKMVETNREIHTKAIRKYNGKLLKELGDGMLLSFESVSDGVQCAVDLMKLCRNSDLFELRIGLHLGEVFIDHGDVFGDGVNIASRIQQLAGPGQILVSNSVFMNIKNKNGLNVKSLGEFTLKNIENPMNIFHVEPKH